MHNFKSFSPIQVQLVPNSNLNVDPQYATSLCSCKWYEWSGLPLLFQLSPGLMWFMGRNPAFTYQLIWI